MWGPPLLSKACASGIKSSRAIVMVLIKWGLPLCSPPFWDQCLIGRLLVQNCYAFIASWLTYNKSDGLKGAVQPVLYRVGAFPLRPRCSVLSLYFELLYFLKLIRTRIQFYLLHGYSIHSEISFVPSRLYVFAFYQSLTLLANFSLMIPLSPLIACFPVGIN